MGQQERQILETWKIVIALSCESLKFRLTSSQIGRPSSIAPVITPTVTRGPFDLNVNMSFRAFADTANAVLEGQPPLESCINSTVLATLTEIWGRGDIGKKESNKARNTNPQVGQTIKGTLNMSGVNIHHS